MGAPTVEPLVAPHVLEYTYTRSTGPVLGAFLAGLRDGHILGVKATDGRVLVPPAEYDPVTSEDLTELVEVSDVGTVTTWAWNDTPLEGQPLDRPFAWALVKPDGADTAMLAALDAVDTSALRTGMRVRARWAAERVGSIRDLLCFEPVADDYQSEHANCGYLQTAREPVSITEVPLRLDYTYTPGVAAARFLTSIEQGKIVGEKCPSCGKVYIPPRGACSMCGVATIEGVELDGKGIVTTFAVTRIPSPGMDAPYVSAWIKLDGADITSMFLVKEIDPDEVRLGMRVEPVWVEESERTKNLANIAYYRPTGEPDAPYETYRDYV